MVVAGSGAAASSSGAALAEGVTDGSALATGGGESSRAIRSRWR